MPISVRCPCGKKYSVAEDKAGKRIRCKACGEIMEVPDDDELEVLEEEDETDDEVFEAAPRRRTGAARSSQSRRSKKSNNALPLIIAAVALGGVLVIGVAVFAIRAGGANPNPAPGQPPVAMNPPNTVPGAAPTGMAPPNGSNNPASTPASPAPAAGTAWVVISNLKVGDPQGLSTPISIDYKFAQGAPDPGAKYVLRLTAPLAGTLEKYWEIPVILSPSGGSVSGAVGIDFNHRERVTAVIGLQKGQTGFGGNALEPISGELAPGAATSAAQPPLTASQAAGAAAAGKLFALANGRTERGIGPSPNFSVDWELQGEPEPTARYQWIIKTANGSVEVDISNDFRPGLNMVKRGTFRARAIGAGISGPYEMWIEKRQLGIRPRTAGEQVSNVLSVQ